MLKKRGFKILFSPQKFLTVFKNHYAQCLYNLNFDNSKKKPESFHMAFAWILYPFSGVGE